VKDLLPIHYCNAQHLSVDKPHNNRVERIRSRNPNLMLNFSSLGIEVFQNFDDFHESWIGATQWRGVEIDQLKHLPVGRLK
jgi:hypothetical protein